MQGHLTLPNFVRQAQQRAKIADEMRTAFKVSLFLILIFEYFFRGTIAGEMRTVFKVALSLASQLSRSLACFLSFARDHARVYYHYCCIIIIIVVLLSLYYYCCIIIIVVVLLLSVSICGCAIAHELCRPCRAILNTYDDMYDVVFYYKK